MRILGVAVAMVMVSSPAVAYTQTVPVDPGPIAKGRPIVGTTQNLPSLDSSVPYDAGPGFAPQLRKIYQNGTIRSLQQEVAQDARNTVTQWIRKHPDAKKPAVVFDVDDTMLNNFEEYNSNDPAFSYNPESDKQFTLECKATANVPVRRLYRKFQAAGLRIAVITGRPADQRSATIDCLQKRGFPRWNKLITRTEANSSLTSARFKAKAREALQDDGWTIVASVGDQISDMSYGRMKYGFLMPNPMYYLP
jgi:predicted secreted acid phosphatase